MDQELAQQLSQAESDIAESEQLHGPMHADLAEKLSKYAALLRKTEMRALDAVNVEARAKAIRARLYHDAVLTQETKIHIIKPMEKQANPATYIGIVAICIAFASLFLEQSFFAVLAILALLAASGDLVLAGRSAWLRTAVTIGLIGCSWWSIRSLPSIMLTDASPLERLNYGFENPDVVKSVSHMGAPQSLLAYKMCLPAGVDQPVTNIDSNQEWGRLLTWKNTAQAEQPVRMFQVCAMNLPARIGKFPAVPLGKLAKDVVVQRISDELGLSDVKQDPLKFEEINGFEFARVHFSGNLMDSGERLFVFAYVARDKNSLLVVSGNDKGPDFESLEPMEASVYTIRKEFGKEVKI